MKLVGYGHSTCIGLLLNECYGQEMFCDVTLHCLVDSSNEVFILRANSSVLAAAYPVFRALLQARCADTTDIHVTIVGCRYDEISSLLQFAYTGIIPNCKDAATLSTMKNFGVDFTLLKTEPCVPKSQPVAIITTTAPPPVNQQNKRDSQTLRKIAPSRHDEKNGTDSVSSTQPVPDTEVGLKPVLIDGNYVFRCHICGRTFKFIRGLEAHMLGHNPNPKNSLQCAKCGAYFLNSGTFTRHERICSSENLLSYKCRVCNSGFSTKDSVKKHMNRFHRNSPIEENGSEEQFKCLACGKVFMKQDSLTAHQRTAHGCFQKKGNKQENVSSDEGEFQCSLCPRNFPASEQLNDHLSLHTSGRLFECDVCSCAYDTISNLTRHQTKHRLDFECSICYRKFQSPVDKEEHDVIHHMEVQGEEII